MDIKRKTEFINIVKDHISTKDSKWKITRVSDNSYVAKRTLTIDDLISIDDTIEIKMIYRIKQIIVSEDEYNDI